MSGSPVCPPGQASQWRGLCHPLCCQQARKKPYGTHNRWGRIPTGVPSTSTRLSWRATPPLMTANSTPSLTKTTRKSCLALIVKVSTKAAEGAKRAVLDLLEPLARRVHTLTSEMARNSPLTKALLRPWGLTSPSLILMPPGRAASTKTPTASFGTTSRRAVIAPPSLTRRCKGSWTNSTTLFERCLGMKTP